MKARFCVQMCLMLIMPCAMVITPATAAAQARYTAKQTGDVADIRCPGTPRVGLY